jgi:purine nucleosidase
VFDQLDTTGEALILMTMKVVLDTDIGTDVDDALALAVLLGSPEVDLLGVTCVYGNVPLRVRMVRKLLRLAGRTEVPVYAGMEPPLLGVRPVFWQGHEGVGLLDPEDEGLLPESEHAVDYLLRISREHPGEIQLVTIGPLGNIAMAIRRDPGFLDRLAGLTIMGGVFRGPGRWNVRHNEHNIVSDPEAAQVVFGTNPRCTLVPLDVTRQTLIRPADVTRIRNGGSAFALAVADQVDRYPRFQDLGHTYLHDPLAVALLLDPSLGRYEEMRIEIETGGRVCEGMTVPIIDPDGNNPVRVALDVDVPRAEEFIISRIAAVAPRG